MREIIFKVKCMVKELTQIEMEIATKEISKMINQTEQESNSIPKKRVRITLVSLKKEKKMEKEKSDGKMELLMRDSLKMEKFMVMESWKGLMVNAMKGTTKTIK